MLTGMPKGIQGLCAQGRARHCCLGHQFFVVGIRGFKARPRRQVSVRRLCSEAGPRRGAGRPLQQSQVCCTTAGNRRGSKRVVGWAARADRYLVQVWGSGRPTPSFSAPWGRNELAVRTLFEGQGLAKEGLARRVFSHQGLNFQPAATYPAEHRHM